jgi:hypothetical protein
MPSDKPLERRELFVVTVNLYPNKLRAETCYPVEACEVTWVVEADSVGEAIAKLELGRDVRNIEVKSARYHP